MRLFLILAFGVSLSNYAVAPIQFTQRSFIQLSGQDSASNLPFLLNVPVNYQLYITPLKRELALLHPEDGKRFVLVGGDFSLFYPEWPVYRVSILTRKKDEELVQALEQRSANIKLLAESIINFSRAYTKIQVVEGQRQLSSGGVPAGMIFIDNKLGQSWIIEFTSTARYRGDEGGMWRLLRDSFLEPVSNSELASANPLITHVVYPRFFDDPRFSRDRYDCPLEDIRFDLKKGERLASSLTLEKELVGDLKIETACRVLTFTRLRAFDFPSGIFVAYDRYYEFRQSFDSVEKSCLLGIFFKGGRKVHHETLCYTKEEVIANTDPSYNFSLQRAILLKAYYRQRGPAFQEYYKPIFY